MTPRTERLAILNSLLEVVVSEFDGLTIDDLLELLSVAARAIDANRAAT